MKQLKPAARALCERVRRPTTIRLLIAGGLMLPAVLINGRSGPAHTMGITTMPALIVDVSKEALKDVPPANPNERLLGTPVSEARAANAAEAETGQLALPVSKYAVEYGISEPLARQIHTAAAANGISPRTAFGLVRAESSFRTKAVSPVGAVGLTQIMPATARWLKPGTTRQDLMNPQFNLNLGFTYLRRLIDDYNGDERLALTAFNRGPGTVNKLLRRGRNPDNGYADKVLTGRSAKHVALMNAKFGGRK